MPLPPHLSSAVELLSIGINVKLFVTSLSVAILWTWRWLDLGLLGEVLFGKVENVSSTDSIEVSVMLIGGFVFMRLRLKPFLGLIHTTIQIVLLF